MVEGVKTVNELLSSNYKIESVYASNARELNIDEQSLTIVKEKELERASFLKSANSVIAVAKIPEEQIINYDDSLILILDGIRDPGNLGTIIRTAKWFGVNTIICSEDCVDAFSPKVVQSTMGALFHVDIVYKDIQTFVTDLKAKGFHINGAAIQGASIYKTDKPSKTALIIGSESHGIREDVLKQCNSLVTIPNLEEEQKVESLNAAIATSIILSELTR